MYSIFFSPAMYVNQIFGMMFSFAFITRNKQMKQMRNAHTTNTNNVLEYKCEIVNTK